MNDQATTLGQRLRAERVRRAASGTDFAQALGVTERTQRNYESDERVPDARYLAAALSLGVDVEFVLGGHRRSVRLLSEGAEATAVVAAVNIVEEVCTARSAGLSAYKKARLVAVVHRQIVAGLNPSAADVAGLVDLATAEP
jgi:transcriptional regulator with XRE-family HTH domain